MLVSPLAYGVALAPSARKPVDSVRRVSTYRAESISGLPPEMVTRLIALKATEIMRGKGVMGQFTTFNTLLRNVGIDPEDVRLLRHKPKAQNGITLFQMREENPAKFDQYQQPQERGKKLFVTSKFWASFVVSQHGRTVFAGLYRVNGYVSLAPDWIDPYTQKRPGSDNGKKYDWYQIEPCRELSSHIDVLEIDWPRENVRSWARYAVGADWPVTHINGYASQNFVDQFELNEAKKSEVERRASLSMVPIRDPRVRAAALRRANGVCEYCGEAGFKMADGRIYLETHHIVSLADGGPDHVSNVIALCPNHHREAHHGKDRLRLQCEFQQRFR
jgi:HNH endonuclease